MQGDRAYNGSVKYVKHQKHGQSASLFFLLTPLIWRNSHFVTTGQVPAKDISPSVLMGCTGNALATGIDAPPEPKVSPILRRFPVPLIGGGTGDSSKQSLYICPWNSVI